MKIDLDHFETLEELEKHLIMWVKEEDPFSFNRYLNQEDVLKIVQMLIKSNFEIERLNNIIKEVREYIQKNCILSDEWTDLDFCNFTPTGRIKYKQLTPKKVEKLLEILDKADKGE